ncbi:zinc metalloprotease HtpX [Virgibacillus sp. W0430]|uniref:zinc metalloprotease HtpX n=1 Tax=Virgibacillus sp. W0430 TaxID=3391580 RepID=UPI003F47D6BF
MLYKQIQQNKQKTVGLVLLFTVLVLAAGWAIGFLFNNDMYSGLIITAIIVAVYIPVTYMSASSQVLGMSGAKEIKREDNPQLFDIVEELTIAARLPMPKIYIIHDATPNAFATGIKPEKASVAFTTGLLDKLNREEITAVAAHELAHVRNYDIRLMTVCIALVGVIILIADIGSRMLFFRGGSRDGGRKTHPALIVVALVLIIVAPIAAQMVRLAVSRNREYLADATAVEFTRNPVGLINALRKISNDPGDVKHAKDATASMYIASPFGRKRRKNKGSLWATHPPIERRIEALQNM